MNQAVFRLDLTDEQQRSYSRITGSLHGSFQITRRRLSMLALAAASTGRGVLPLSTSADTTRLILHATPGSAVAPDLFVVWIRLTDEQNATIRELTGHDIRMIAVAPDEEDTRFYEEWQDAEPFRLGSSITLVPGAAPDGSAADAGRVYLPATVGRGVFGTGRHPTTRAAMLAMEDCIRAGDRVLDVGTGSGILAVAAMRLGAASVHATDIDEQAVAFARETAALNGVRDRVSAEVGSLEHAPSQYDVVLMNLFPRLILSMAPHVQRVLLPGARVVTSGVVAARAGHILARMTDCGYTELYRREESGWTAQVFVRA